MGPVHGRPDLDLGFYGAPNYWDVVEAASFPLARLRFRNDDLLAQLGVDPAAVTDAHLEAAYGRFEACTPWSRGGDGRLTLKGGVREVMNRLRPASP